LAGKKYHASIARWSRRPSQQLAVFGNHGRCHNLSARHFPKLLRSAHKQRTSVTNATVARRVFNTYIDGVGPMPTHRVEGRLREDGKSHCLNVVTLLAAAAILKKRSVDSRRECRTKIAPLSVHNRTRQRQSRRISSASIITPTASSAAQHDRRKQSTRSAVRKSPLRTLRVVPHGMATDRSIARTFGRMTLAVPQPEA
jgi:hypothetical protein